MEKDLKIKILTLYNWGHDYRQFFKENEGYEDSKLGILGLFFLMTSGIYVFCGALTSFLFSVAVSLMGEDEIVTLFMDVAPSVIVVTFFISHGCTLLSELGLLLIKKLKKQ